MYTGESWPSEGPARSGSAHRAAGLIAVLVLAGALSVILYTHGSVWWYAPLALAAIVPVHLAVLAVVVLVATRFVGRHGGASPCHEGRVSLLLHKPRQFEWLARAITLGREKKLRQWTLDLADLRSGSRVLDVGCGTGTLLLAAAERVGPSGRLHGLEPSPEMAEHARQKAETYGVKLEIVRGSAGGLPYPAASFDAVLSTLVFHHLPRAMRQDALREMRRVLRPGGRAVIVDWQRPRSVARAIASPLVLVYLLHGFGPGGSPLAGPDLEARMRELGFADVTRSAFGGAGVVGAIAGRLPAEGAHP